MPFTKWSVMSEIAQKQGEWTIESKLALTFYGETPQASPAVKAAAEKDDMVPAYYEHDEQNQWL